MFLNSEFVVCVCVEHFVNQSLRFCAAVQTNANCVQMKICSMPFRCIVECIHAIRLGALFAGTDLMEHHTIRLQIQIQAIVNIENPIRLVRI